MYDSQRKRASKDRITSSMQGKYKTGGIKMSLKMNDARLAILRKYYGRISIEGENENEIVVRIHFNDPKTTEEAYNELVDVVEE